MNRVFGIWVVFVALAISCIAAYYSIVGLAAIFSASLVPVIVMGSALEVGKITSAVWLHVYWERAASILKLYLVSATVVLMLITSMGIFGFLSKAHIEQNADAAIVESKVGSIDSRIAREREGIARLEERIAHYAERAGRVRERQGAEGDSRSSVADSIDGSIRIALGEIEGIELDMERLRAAEATLESGSVRDIQRLAGVAVDGSMGPRTEAAVAAKRSALRAERKGLASRRAEIQAEIDGRNAEKERVLLEERESAANSDSGEAELKRIDGEIASTEAEIADAFGRIQTLESERFELDREIRLFEVEVGPVKYLAEMVYGEADRDLLERAVRWVIMTLVFVFDPLAVALVLAGVSVLRMKPVDPPAPAGPPPAPVIPAEPAVDPARPFEHVRLQGGETVPVGHADDDRDSGETGAGAEAAPAEDRVDEPESELPLFPAEEVPRDAPEGADAAPEAPMAEDGADEAPAGPEGADEAPEAPDGAENAEGPAESGFIGERAEGDSRIRIAGYSVKNRTLVADRNSKSLEDSR